MTNQPTTIRAMAEQLAEKLSDRVTEDEFEATGQHGGSYASHFIEELLKFAEALQAQGEARINELESEWSIMARACGNWRDFGVPLTPEAEERRKLIGDAEYQCAARAIIERGELKKQLTDCEARMQERLKPFLRHADNCPMIFRITLSDAERQAGWKTAERHCTCGLLAAIRADQP